MLGQAQSSGPRGLYRMRHWPLGKAAPSGTPLLYLVTSGAELGWTCFMMVWIQFRRIPDVMAERVNSPSFVYTKNKALSGTTVPSPPPKEVPQGGLRPP